jgi:hypothetical protein
MSRWLRIDRVTSERRGPLLDRLVKTGAVIAEERRINDTLFLRFEDEDSLELIEMVMVDRTIPLDSGHVDVRVLESALFEAEFNELSEHSVIVLEDEDSGFKQTIQKVKQEISQQEASQEILQQKVQVKQAE